jgi:hypothetical protein
MKLPLPFRDPAVCVECGHLANKGNGHYRDCKRSPDYRPPQKIKKKKK